jgi:fibronectin type 3 domain-containing protein
VSNGGSAITGYRVYRGTASGGETFLVMVNGSTLSFTDASVGRKTKYWYRVTASNTIGESGFSNEVSIASK